MRSLKTTVGCRRRRRRRRSLSRRRFGSFNSFPTSCAVAPAASAVCRRRLLAVLPLLGSTTSSSLSSSRHVTGPYRTAPHVPPLLPATLLNELDADKKTHTVACSYICSPLARSLTRPSVHSFARARAHHVHLRSLREFALSLDRPINRRDEVNERERGKDCVRGDRQRIIGVPPGETLTERRMGGRMDG